MRFTFQTDDADEAAAIIEVLTRLTTGQLLQAYGSAGYDAPEPAPVESLHTHVPPEPASAPTIEQAALEQHVANVTTAPTADDVRARVLAATSAGATTDQVRDVMRAVSPEAKQLTDLSSDELAAFYTALEPLMGGK